MANVEEFTKRCAENGIEARVQFFPNPGNPMQALQIFSLKNYNKTIVTVTQRNKKFQKIIIPEGGTAEIMITPDEEIPEIIKG
ncbi:MAG TPA: hypothetical protein VFA52_04350 [Candidatus Paceibacterota bacterium]|jgi:hypothetical protein|nr:hypothetical protein [Candidatus Paceibacterota bacterium]